VDHIIIWMWENQ